MSSSKRANLSCDVRTHIACALFQADFGRYFISFVAFFAYPALGRVEARCPNCCTLATAGGIMTDV
jgi:hypothetical protein